MKRVLACLLFCIFLVAGCGRTFPADEQVAGDITRMLMRRDSSLVRFTMAGGWTSHNDSIVGRSIRLYTRTGDSVSIDFMYRRTASAGWKCWGFARVAHE
jgi:hypothetical protein